MGCLCMRMKGNSIPTEKKNLNENIDSINKITTSKYFYKISKLKIEFTFIKNKIQVDIVN